MRRNQATATFPHEPSAPILESWITKTPGVCGGEACVRNTRITVWGLVEWSRLGLNDEEIQERIPDATTEDLQAAWAYYEQNPAEIEAAIRRNEAA